MPAGVMDRRRRRSFAVGNQRWKVDNIADGEAVKASALPRAFGDAEEPELHGKSHRTGHGGGPYRLPRGGLIQRGTVSSTGRFPLRKRKDRQTCMVMPGSGSARVNANPCSRCRARRSAIAGRHPYETAQTGRFAIRFRCVITLPWNDPEPLPRPD